VIKPYFFSIETLLMLVLSIAPLIFVQFFKVSALKKKSNYQKIQFLPSSPPILIHTAFESNMLNP